MNDTQKKALALLNKSIKAQGCRVYDPEKTMRIYDITFPAIVAAIEQHEATKQELSDFRQEVSDALVDFFGSYEATQTDTFRRFIIPAPKPDPLFDVLWELGMAEDRAGVVFAANRINETLDAAGFEIREKGQ